jgi:hypothetical protein
MGSSENLQIFRCFLCAQTFLSHSALIARQFSSINCVQQSSHFTLSLGKMSIIAFKAVCCWFLAVTMPQFVSGQRRRRASFEQHRMDLEDVAFWRALVMEGSTSISSIPTPPPPLSIPMKTPSTPPTKSPVILIPPNEPIVTYEPTVIVFPTKSPTKRPSVSEEPSVSYDQNDGDKPSKC